MTEHRRATRTRAVLRASIIFNNRNSSIDCMIRNLSNTGAKITIDDTIAIPQQFELMILQKGQSFNAKVVWRHLGEAGVEFMNEIVNKNAVPIGHDLSDRLRDLERENAALKKKLADVSGQLARSLECA